MKKITFKLIQNMALVATQPDVALDGRYCINDTLKALGICRKTLYNHTKEGKIRFRLRKDGKKVFYLGSEIIKYWRNNT